MEPQFGDCGRAMLLALGTISLNGRQGVWVATQSESTSFVSPIWQTHVDVFPRVSSSRVDAAYVEGLVKRMEPNGVRMAIIL